MDGEDLEISSIIEEGNLGLDENAPNQIIRAMEEEEKVDD